jgi:hypothetical protein
MRLKDLMENIDDKVRIAVDSFGRTLKSLTVGSEEDQDNILHAKFGQLSKNMTEDEKIAFADELKRKFKITDLND